MNRWNRAAVFALMGVLFLCGAVLAAEQGVIFGHKWCLVSMGGEAVPTLDGEEPVNITFEKGRIFGHGGVNRFFGSYILSGEGLLFGGVGATMMAGPRLDLEGRFFREMRKVTRWKIDGDKLLMLKGETPLMEFKAAPLDK